MIWRAGSEGLESDITIDEMDHNKKMNVKDWRLIGALKEVLKKQAERRFWRSGEGPSLQWLRKFNGLMEQIEARGGEVYKVANGLVAELHVESCGLPSIQAVQVSIPLDVCDGQHEGRFNVEPGARAGGGSQATSRGESQRTRAGERARQRSPAPRELPEGVRWCRASVVGLL